MKTNPAPPPFTQDSADWFGRILWAVAGFICGTILASAAITITDPNGAKIVSLEAGAVDAEHRAIQAENDLAGVRSELHIALNAIADAEVEIAQAKQERIGKVSYRIASDDEFNKSNEELKRLVSLQSRLEGIRGELSGVVAAAKNNIEQDRGLILGLSTQLVSAHLTNRATLILLRNRVLIDDNSSDIDIPLGLHVHAEGESLKRMISVLNVLCPQISEPPVFLAADRLRVVCRDALAELDDYQHLVPSAMEEKKRLDGVPNQ